MVRFVGVDDMVRLVSAVGIEAFLRGLTDVLTQDFRRWEVFDKVPRVSHASLDGVIELMPVSDGELYAFKYVTGHPGNTLRGLRTVTGFGVLAEVATGYPLLLSEMTLLTALRTAAVSALAARHLARRDSAVMAMIGLGAQAEFQAVAFKALLDVTHLRVHDVDPGATAKFTRNLEPHGFRIVPTRSVAEAVRGADIVTTATAGTRDAAILTAEMIEEGMHVNAIGGDCPGKTELDPAILRRADVFVEFEPQTRVEGEIQQMSAGFAVTELWRVIAGRAEGRRSSRRVTVFDSVGFAVEDFSALRFLRDRVEATDLFRDIDLLPPHADPRDLFGLLDPGSRPSPARARG